MKTIAPRLLFLLPLFAVAASAQSTTNWTGTAGDGIFGNSGNWDNGVPTSSLNANISPGTPTTVTFNNAGSVANLTLSLNNVLDVGGYTLNVYGTSVSNAGQININNGTLTFDSSATLSGAGALNLSSDVYVNQAVGGLTLTNKDNTIAGTGQLGQNGLALNNEAAGTVNANVSSGTLYLNGGGAISNAGLLEATGGGTLLIDNAVTNTGAGHITAGANGTVEVNGATINGGTLNASATGSLMETNGSATLNGVTLSSGSTYTASGTTYLQGTITNNGTIASPNGTIQVLGGDLTLKGGGTVTLQSDAYFDENVAGYTLHNVDNLIQGTGQLGQNGLSLDNQAGGTVNANVSGGDLYLNGGGAVSNANLIEATNGGTLLVQNAVTNTGVGNITAGANSTVEVNNATINGGVLNASATGSVMETVGNATLNGVTLSSGSTYTASGTTYVQGTITNNGTITSPDGTIQVLGGDLMLKGGGTVTLQSGAFFDENAGGFTLHNVDNLIQGTGQLGQNGLALDNQAGGTVNANVSGGDLYLNGGGAVSNANLIEATNGGTLLVQNAVTNTGVGNITAGANSTVEVNNATINGGTLNASATGSVMETVGNATLNGVTLSSGSTYTASGTTYVQGTITNNGTITSPDGTIQVLGGDLMLKGGGTVTLQSGAFFDENAGGFTLHNVDNLIQGTGQLGQNGLSLDNQAGGTVNANVSGSTLYLNGGGSVSNAGVLAATNGGTLAMATSNALTNFGGNTLTGGTYYVSGSAALGGTSALKLNLGANTGGEIVNNAATIILDGPTANTLFEDANGNAALTNLAANSTSSANLTIKGGYALQTPGFFSNAGSVTIGGGSSSSSLTVGLLGTSSYNQSGGSTLIKSDGTLTATSVNEAGGTIQVDGLLDPVDVHVSSILSGTGTVLGDITNDGQVILGDSTAAPGTLSEIGNYVQNSDGILDESISSATNGMFDVTGSVSLDGTVNIDLLGGFTPTHDEEFTLIDFTGLQTGTLGVTGSDAADWTVLYTPTQVDLEFTNPVIQHGVPDTGATWMLLGFALAGLGAAARFKRRMA